MSGRRPAHLGCVAGLAILVGTTATANEIPRTPDGRPDFSGNYDISTLTPIERSPELGDRLHLTEEEAERIRSQEAARVDLTSRASDPNRSAPASGAGVGGYNYFFMDRGTSAVKVGGRYRTSLIVDPPNGRFPPLTERGKARRDGVLRVLPPEPGQGVVARPRGRTHTTTRSRSRSPTAASSRSRERSRSIPSSTTT